MGIIRKEYLAHLALFMVNTLYGANHVLAKGVMPQFLTPNVFIFFRILGATILFWIVKSFYVREKIEPSDFIKMGICAIFGVTVNQLFFFHGLNLSSAINSGIFMSINPILVTILSLFILKDKVTPTRAFGILLGTTATILLTLTAGTGKGDSVLGDTFLFINAASYAIYLVMAKPLMQRYSPLTVITWVFTFGLFFVLIFPPTLIDLYQTNFSVITVHVWYKISYVIIGVTFFTYLLTMFGLKHLSPTVSSSYIYFQPILVMAFAYLFLNMGIAEDYTQTITWEKTGYMLAIFFAVYLTSKGSILLKASK